jgi:hypothetical protein
MSDESSRSARPSGQRRNDGAPAWWPALERVDLPEDEGVPAAHRRWYEEQKAAASPPAPAPSEAAHPVRPAWVFNTLVVLAFALVVMVVLGVVLDSGSSDSSVLIVTMLVGVPLILVVITTLIVARRSR